MEGHTTMFVNFIQTLLKAPSALCWVNATVCLLGVVL